MADVPILHDAGASRLEVIRRIRALERIPTPPKEQQRLLVALADPNLELNAIADLIDQCPPVAARVMGVARSAFFATGAPARSVRDAVVRVLGLRLVADLVNCVALSSPLQVRKCPGFDPARYWMGAVATATLARRFATDAVRLDAESRRSAYLCGLLHSLGVLVLVHLDPERMSRVFAAAHDPESESLAALELNHLGITHQEAGERLATAWGLPLEIRVVMRHHHEPEYRGHHWMPALLVGTAARFTPLLLDPEHGPIEKVPDLEVLGLDHQRISAQLASVADSVEELSELARQLA